MPEMSLRQMGEPCARAAGGVAMSAARRLDEAISFLMRGPSLTRPLTRKTNCSQLSFLTATCAGWQGTRCQPVCINVGAGPICVTSAGVMRLLLFDRGCSARLRVPTLSIGARGRRRLILWRHLRAALAASTGGAGLGTRNALRRGVAALGLLARRHGLEHAARLRRRTALQTERLILLILRHRRRRQKKRGDDPCGRDQCAH